MVKELTTATARLSALLARPEYGLASWSSAVGDALDEIARFAPSYRRMDGSDG